MNAFQPSFFLLCYRSSYSCYFLLIFVILIEIFKDSSVAPKERWSAVPRKISVLFTAIQMACLGAMVYVKESPIGVLFPVVIAMLAPLRFYLEKSGVVKKEYMDVLDEE